jgi:molybdate transport system regulatory protein
MQIKVKTWFEINGEYVFGEGRAELLRCIEEFGSIKKSASALKMSYRHAWGQIRKMEGRLGIKLVETQVGGRGGGKADLTDAAKELLLKYDELRHNIDVFVQENCREKLRNILFQQ